MLELEEVRTKVSFSGRLNDVWLASECIINLLHNAGSKVTYSLISRALMPIHYSRLADGS